MKRIQYAVLILVVFPAFLLSSCCPPPSMEIPDETPQDEYLIDSLQGSVDPPFELDKEKIDILVEEIKEGEHGKIHSLIIIHNDKLVLEKYFMGWTRHMRHRLFSATKSCSSALIGIAIDKGYIDGVDENLLSFFPEYDDIENLDARKESITLENVLTMTAGFSWDELSEPYFDECGNPNPKNDWTKATESNDWIKCVLDIPMIDDPGTKFEYNSGGSHLLSGILTNTTGQTTEKFAEENLFNKLGIKNWEWEKDPNDLSHTGGGLILHPVNMAMFGYLYLKNGFLNGEQVISEDWVKESTVKHVEIIDPNSGELNGYYGYQWWFFRDGNVYYARGFLGQFIFVIPGLNMVIVLTGENSEDPFVSSAVILTSIVNALIVKN